MPVLPDHQRPDSQVWFQARYQATRAHTRGFRGHTNGDLESARARIQGHFALRKLGPQSHQGRVHLPCARECRDLGLALIPTNLFLKSAFSKLFTEFGHNFYELFSPDFMHEFELGVWKNTFHHLMRLLELQGEDAVEEFNAR